MTTMNYLLPSEIARLVLGYLKEVNCHRTYNVFLEESADIQEYALLLKIGREYPTTIDGESLVTKLNNYCLRKASGSASQSGSNKYNNVINLLQSGTTNVTNALQAGTTNVSPHTNTLQLGTVNVNSQTQYVLHSETPDSSLLQSGTGTSFTQSSVRQGRPTRIDTAVSRPICTSQVAPTVQRPLNPVSSNVLLSMPDITTAVSNRRGQNKQSSRTRHLNMCLQVSQSLQGFNKPPSHTITSNSMKIANTNGNIANTNENIANTNENSDTFGNANTSENDIQFDDQASIGSPCQSLRIIESPFKSPNRPEATSSPLKRATRQRVRRKLTSPNKPGYRKEFPNVISGSSESLPGVEQNSENSGVSRENVKTNSQLNTGMSNSVGSRNNTQSNNSSNTQLGAISRDGTKTVKELIDISKGGLIDRREEPIERREELIERRESMEQIRKQQEQTPPKKPTSSVYSATAMFGEMSPADSCSTAFTSELNTPNKDRLSTLRRTPKRKSHAPKRRSFPTATLDELRPPTGRPETTSEKTSRPPVEDLIDMPNIIQDLLNNPDIHNKLAENINKASSAIHVPPKAQKTGVQKKVSSPAVKKRVRSGQATLTAPVSDLEPGPVPHERSLEAILGIEENTMDETAIKDIVTMTQTDPAFDALFDLFKVDKDDFIEKEYLSKSASKKSLTLQHQQMHSNSATTPQQQQQQFQQVHSNRSATPQRQQQVHLNEKLHMSPEMHSTRNLQNIQHEVHKMENILSPCVPDTQIEPSENNPSTSLNSSSELPQNNNNQSAKIHLLDGAAMPLCTTAGSTRIPAKTSNRKINSSMDENEINDSLEIECASDIQIVKELQTKSGNATGKKSVKGTTKKKPKLKATLSLPKKTIGAKNKGAVKKKSLKTESLDGASTISAKQASDLGLVTATCPATSRTPRKIAPKLGGASVYMMSPSKPSPYNVQPATLVQLTPSKQIVTSSNTTGAVQSLHFSPKQIPITVTLNNQVIPSTNPIIIQTQGPPIGPNITQGSMGVTQTNSGSLGVTSCNPGTGTRQTTLSETIQNVERTRPALEQGVPRDVQDIRKLESELVSENINRLKAQQKVSTGRKKSSSNSKDENDLPSVPPIGGNSDEMLPSIEPHSPSELQNKLKKVSKSSAIKIATHIRTLSFDSSKEEITYKGYHTRNRGSKTRTIQNVVPTTEHSSISQNINPKLTNPVSSVCEQEGKTWNNVVMVNTLGKGVKSDDKHELDELNDDPGMNEKDLESSVEELTPGDMETESRSSCENQVKERLSTKTDKKSPSRKSKRNTRKDSKSGKSKISKSKESSKILKKSKELKSTLPEAPFVPTSIEQSTPRKSNNVESDDRSFETEVAEALVALGTEVRTPNKDGVIVSIPDFTPEKCFVEKGFKTPTKNFASPSKCMSPRTAQLQSLIDLANIQHEEIQMANTTRSNGASPSGKSIMKSPSTSGLKAVKFSSIKDRSPSAKTSSKRVQFSPSVVDNSHSNSPKKLDSKRKSKTKSKKTSKIPKVIQETTQTLNKSQSSDVPAPHVSSDDPQLPTSTTKVNGELEASDVDKQNNSSHEDGPHETPKPTSRKRKREPDGEETRKKKPKKYKTKSKSKKLPVNLGEMDIDAFLAKIHQ
ncbi:unnamed protein product [Owenia fusiformis]|uniref:Uncharacterized protein n=1 Tax=Owenia fusiformis TaxID=6347 RepID=A0A8J1TEB8_OWEFU|nr:unnamed protein product [Owenia fusiformis]